MDKRTLLFLVCVSISLFLINTYFEKEHQSDLQKWNAQQIAVKAQTEKALEAEIRTQTANLSALPFVPVYEDAEGKDLFGFGVENENSIFLIKKNTSPLPRQIFKKKKDESILTPLHLAFDQNIPQGVGVYLENVEKQVPVGKLPEFGKYFLQIVYSSPEHPDHSPQSILAEFSEGHLSFPEDTLAKMKNETEEQITLPSQQILNNGLALIKTPNGFLPAALYDSSTKSLLLLSDIPDLEPILKKETKTLTAQKKVQELFYVLENEYQQLVFSNYGGAIAEINLPFETSSDEKSVVREIQFDRDMLEQNPQNARFPAHPYYTSGNKSGESIEHKEGKLGGYYPLLRRDLIEPAGHKSIRVAPRYYALNIVSEYPEMAELVYEVKQFDSQSIVFESVQSHRRITKTYTIEEESKGGPYCVNLTIKIEGDARGLWLTSGVPEVEWISGGPAPSLKYRITRNQKADVETIELPKDSTSVSSIYPDWICNSNGFLGMILDPLSEINPGYRVQHISGTTVPSRLVEIDQKYERFKAQNLPGYMIMLPLKSNGGVMDFRIFAGPFANRVLKQVDKTYSNPAIGYNPDYIACQTFHGWFAFISEPFAKFLFILMDFFHQLTGSWGFSIILLTVALRIMLYPLNAWSAKSMLNMQQISPQVAAIQEKYKKDPKKAQLEIMNLYREKGVNPVSGCFPLLIQMPFLIGMFDLLKSTFELRGAPFIPGWINDLTAPDVVFSWSMPIFFIGNQFHLLPLLLGGVMFLQQKLSSTMPSDPNLLTDQQRQQKAMGSIMTVVFTVMFYNFPSGLNIYWLSSMVLGIAQQWWTSKQFKQKTQNPVKTISKS